MGEAKFAFALYDGRDEDVSWACIILARDGPVESVEEALIELHNVVVAYVNDNIRPRKEKRGCGQKGCKCDCKSSWLLEENYVSNVVKEMINGTMQDHGGMYEYLEDAGWYTISPEDSVSIVTVHNTPDVIASIANINNLGRYVVGLPPKMKLYSQQSDNRKNEQ